MRPTVALFLWWRSRIFVYRKASYSTRCATSFLNHAKSSNDASDLDSSKPPGQEP
jgi:hypothetical protein